MRLVLAALAGALALPAAAADWRTPDPQNLLVIDSSKGRIVVELRPEFAPQAVERVKRLAREGVYDGLLFHRVIEGFVDQTGNPNNQDGGTSAHPDLAPEFVFRLPAGAATLVRRADDGQEGFVGSSPIAGVGAAEQARGDGRLRAWGAYCAGTVGMGRQADPGSANSEIFFMRAPARRLDRDYTVFGQTIVGLDVVRAMAVGEPPAEPDRMTRVRVAADLAPAERPRIEVMDVTGKAFANLVARTRKARGADFSVCDLAVPARPAP